jgi:hypothetical protein
MKAKMAQAPTSSALAVPPPEPPKPWDDVALQRLWLATQRREWRTLALVGASKAVDTLHLAQLFAKLAWWWSGQPSCTFDLRDLSLRLVQYHQREVAAQSETGARVFIALGSTLANPTAVPMARSADAVLLVVDLGEAKFKDAQQTIDQVGRDRFLGAIVVRPPDPRRPASETRGRR